MSNNSSKSNNNRTRVISGLVLFLILVLLDIAGEKEAGRAVLLIVCGVVSEIGLTEYFNALNLKRSRIALPTYILSGLYYVGLYFKKESIILPFMIAAFFVLALTVLISFPKVRIHEFALAFTGIVYVPVFMSFLYLIRIMPQGLYLFVIIFLSSWLGDTFGYAVGRRIGKHKMTPLLSPKKSWEGLIGEIVGVTLFCGLFGWIFREKLDMSYNHPLLACLVCGLCGSIISVCGDLFASALKREYGIKDYGNLIPGHGGILDRFDSMIFIAPFIYIVFNFVGLSNL